MRPRAIDFNKREEQTITCVDNERTDGLTDSLRDPSLFTLSLLYQLINCNPYHHSEILFYLRLTTDKYNNTTVEILSSDNSALLSTREATEKKNI